MDMQHFIFLARLNMLFSYKNMENPKDNIQTWNRFYILVCVGNITMITYTSIISLKPFMKICKCNKWS